MRNCRSSFWKRVPGFAVSEILYADDGSVRGVATGHVGLGKDGEPRAAFQLSMELAGRYTIFAEGARGQLGRQLLDRFRLTEGKAIRVAGCASPGAAG